VADEVQISNVGGNGVASEVTLAAILSAMQKKDSSKGKGGSAAKVQELANKAVADGTTATKTNTSATDKAAAATTKAAEETNKFARSLAGAASVGIGKLIGSVGGLTKELLGSSEDLSSFAQHLPFIGGYLGPLAGMIDENIDSFRRLSQVGATFGDGLNDIRAASARAGIPLGEFTDLVSQNATRMKFFGATTATGAVAFANMSKELRSGPGKAFLALGYTAQELNESLIDYAEFSQTQVGVDRQNSKMSAAGAANYLETIDQLAAVTGKRRDQIKEEMNASMSDQRARLAMANMSKEEQTKFAANLAAAPAALQDALKDAADGVLNNPLSQGLSVASETFRKDAAKIKNMNAQEYNNFMARVSQELDAAGAAAGAGAEAIMNSGTGYGQALAMAAELRDKQIMSDKQYADLLEARNKEAATDEGLKGFSNAIRDLRTGIMDTFVSSGALKTIQDAFDSLAATIGTEEFKTGLKTVVEGLVGGLKLLLGAVTTVIEFLGSIGDTFGTAGVIAAVVAGIGTLFAAKAVTGALASKIGGAVKNRALSAVGLGSTPAGASLASPAAPAGKSGPSSNMGKTIGDFGKGLGKGIGGIFKGLASGISAFANPTVALGAVGFGVAIAAIGAGIAGATWLIGQALPTFAEGMESFQELDGDKLLGIGKGIGAIGIAMAAMGAGGAVGAVGGVISGIASFFGADSPIDKLVEFSNLDVDASKVLANADAMQKMGSAFAQFSMNSNIGSVSIDDDIVDAFKALSKIGAGLGGTADSLGRIAGITGLQPVLNSLKFDADGVNQYNTAMEKLVDTLGELNEVLAEDNKGMFGGGSGVAAKDALGAVGSSTSGGSEGMNQLNTIMTQVLTVLNEMRTIDDKIEKNTKNITANNLATGYVSNTG